MPDGIGFVDAAALPQAGGLALQGLRLARVGAGDRVLVNGAGGGAGTLAVQLARRAGAEVTAVDRADKLDLLTGSARPGRSISPTRRPGSRRPTAGTTRSSSSSRAAASGTTGACSHHGADS